MSTPDTLQHLGSPLRELHGRFAAMVDPLRPALWRYCLRLTGSAWDTEDLVQETLTRAFARLTGYWQPLEPKSYLFRIATNAWIDQQRKARVRLDDLESIPEPADERAPADPAGAWAAMEELVGALPPRQRVILLLVDVFDFTATEVAAMVGSTEGAAKAALHRARETLRQQAAAGGAGGAGRNKAAERRTAPPTALVGRYVDAFNRRDVEALCALMSDEIIADIVGVAEEATLAYRKQFSMSEWAADPQPMWAEPGLLDGRPCLFVFFRTAEHERALAWVIELEEAGGKVVRERNYCFCPDLLTYAAAALGEPTALYGYSYSASAPEEHP